MHSCRNFAEIRIQYPWTTMTFNGIIDTMKMDKSAYVACTFSRPVFDHTQELSLPSSGITGPINKSHQSQDKSLSAKLKWVVQFRLKKTAGFWVEHNGITKGTTTTTPTGFILSEQNNRTDQTLKQIHREVNLIFSLSFCLENQTTKKKKWRRRQEYK